MAAELVKEAVERCLLGDFCEGVYGKDKEQRGERVALPEATAMHNRVASHTIENDAGR